MGLLAAPAGAAEADVLKGPHRGGDGLPLAVGSNLESLTVTFSTVMDRARALNKANYVLLVAGSNGKFDRTARRIAVTPKLDAGRRTVTLIPATTLARNRPYRLTLLATNAATGLADAGRVLLDGNRDRQPGGDYVVTFGAPAK